MITHIRMKNFKSWEDSGEVKLAPLTGFFGTNSSGKSSLLQMLLLLKQTIGTDEILFFGDENSLVNLGNFLEVVHKHESETPLELEFGCKLQETFEIKILGENSEGRITNVPVSINNFSFSTIIQAYGKELRTEQFRYGFESCDISEIKWESHYLYYKNLLGEKETVQMVTTNFYGGPVSAAPDVLKSLLFALEELFAYVYYLGPTRVHPQRDYHWEKTHPKEIDMWGNKAVDALLSARVRQLTTAHNGKDTSIEERISTWLEKMDLAYSFQLVPRGNLDDNNYEVRFQRSPSSAKVTLADMGHGVADLFPLLVHCCYVPEGSTLILEQPGIHLHPKAQADLADLFLEVIKERNLQILIESHSEHLLNRLQRRVAEEKIAADQTALYFCQHINGASKIDRLEMDEFGNITNWPENFFGDEMGDLFAMTEAQRERQKRAEG